MLARLVRLAPGLAFAGGILALWGVLAAGGVLSKADFSDPITVAGELVGELGTAVFWDQVWDTLLGWALGLGISVAVAVPVGVVLASSPPLFSAMRSTLEFLRPVPPVALIPVLVLIYGPTLEMKVVLIICGAVWPILFQTIYGVRDVEPVVRDTARCFGLGPIARAFYVVLPTALPSIITGIRIAAAIALVVGIGAELIVGVAGVGSAMNVAQQSGAVAKTWALVAVAGILGVVINAAFRTSERRILHWHIATRRADA